MGAPSPDRFLSRRRVVQLIAAAAALLAAVGACVLPLYTESTITYSSNAELTETHSLSAWEVMGPSILIVVALPVIFTLVPLPLRGRWWQRLSFVSGALLILFTFAGLMSVGVLFIPATLAAVVALFIKVPQASD